MMTNPIGSLTFMGSANRLNNITPVEKISTLAKEVPAEAATQESIKAVKNENVGKSLDILA